jgi:uncharacterized protein
MYKKKSSLLAGFLFGVLMAIVIVERVVAYKVRQIMNPVQSTNYTMIFENGQITQQVHFQTADYLNLTGWYIPPKNGAVIILQHGYQANSAQMLPIGHLLARHGYGVLFFDFRGHGKSESSIVTLGLLEIRDTHAAVKFLSQQPGINQIGLIGNSMGGATGILATAENPLIRAIAVEGVFSELKEEVGIGIKVKTPLPAFPFDRMFIFFAERQTGYKLSQVAPVEKIGDISPRPIFIMQGGNDERVCPDSGFRLYEAAGEPKHFWFESAAAHVAIYEAAPLEYEKRVVEFFHQYLLSEFP